jgi:hypothetical protein
MVKNRSRGAIIGRRAAADPTEKTMRAVLAYIDPGSGSLIIQMLAGGFAAVAVVAKLYWKRLLRVLRIRRPEDEGSIS